MEDVRGIIPCGRPPGGIGIPGIPNGGGGTPASFHQHFCLQALFLTGHASRESKGWWWVNTRVLTEHGI